MSELPIDCPYCGKPGHAWFGQSAPDSYLRWYRSVRCPTDGTYEEDDIGFPPDSLREALLTGGGTWKLIAESDRVTCVAAVRKILGISLAEAQWKLREFPVLEGGTRVEMEWLAARMADDGAAARVERA